MAQNLKTIQIPAEVQLSVKDQAKAMRTIADNLHNIFSNADPGSAFAKSYAKAMAVVEKKLMSSDALLGKEFFSEADLSKVSKYLNDVAEKMAEMRILAQNTPTMTLGFETDELIEATKALAELQARIRETKNAKIGTIAGMNDKPAIKRMLETAEHSNFSTGKSFDENQAAMGKSMGKLSQQVRAYELEAERAKAASEEAEEAAKSAKTALEEAADVLKAREAVNKKVASQVGAIDTTVSRKNNVTKTSIVQQYKDLISQQVVNGSWVDGGEDFARIIAGWLQVPQDALIGPAEDVVRNLHKAIGTAMRGSDISTNVLKRNAKSILDGESAALQQDAGYREAESNVQIADAASQAATREAEDAQKVLANANNNLTQTQELLNKIVAQMEELRELQREYNRLVDANNANDLNNARQRRTQADRDSRQQYMPYVDEGVEGLGSSSRNVTNTLSRQVQGRVEDQMRQNAADQARRDAEQFKQNLQHTINQWMSAQQVINIVKDGIRQAYQDIQGLDAAMTNIAVVTDMSVGDLWGKINEYMSIAQQYGVTTQGVYEVSQLYYQQGLNTNEVMAATTETLKMARIAGMAYTDAANAMTVAIRAFKMEMTDASHVTDVYSKVAAVTASDTEELATAMSKTASSAESVGSSFENTTAMLAVMVETTRESAQNLGSALKSIISRYGEMKQGLTQDSDGEIIDYNKTDAALRSIGISIKDAQGQFRDFDDVIFELSSKWDSLDKNTQRYIATIMAGNRQQSRFIALVDNWERLEEVANAAQDSEDAGLLQYAKTLDSLDTKINNLKTSFQEFYMNIINGPLISGALEALNDLIQGFNKLGSLQGIFNLINIIRGLKTGLKLIVNTFGSSFTNIITSWKNIQTQWLSLAKQSGYERGYAEGQAYGQGLAASQPQSYTSSNNNGGQFQPQTLVTRKVMNAAEQRAYNKKLGLPSGYVSIKTPYSSMSWLEKKQLGLQTGKTSLRLNSWNNSSLGPIVSTGGSLLGGALSAWGSSLAEDNARAGSVVSGLGNIASYASTGAMLGPWGAIIGGIIGGLTSLPSVLEAFEPADILKEKLEKAEEALKEAELDRAQKKETARDLESTIENLKKLQAARYDSEEANAAFIEASNTAAEKFPQLVSGYTSTGDAIIDVINNTVLAERSLIQARTDAAKATLEAAKKEFAVSATEVEQAESEQTTETTGLTNFGAALDKRATDESQFYTKNKYGSFIQLMFSSEELKNSAKSRLTYTVDEYGAPVYGWGTGINADASWTYGSSDVTGRVFGDQPITSEEITELFKLGQNGNPTLEELDGMSLIEQIAYYAQFLLSTTTEDFQRVFNISQKAAENFRKYAIDGFLYDVDDYDIISKDGLSNEQALQQIAILKPTTKEETVKTKQTALEQDTSDLVQAHIYNAAVAKDPLFNGNWFDSEEALAYTTEQIMAELGIDSADFVYDEVLGQVQFADSSLEYEVNARIDEYKAAFDGLQDEQIAALNSLTQQVELGTISEQDARTQLERILGKGNPLIDLYANNFVQIMAEQRGTLYKGIYGEFNNLSKLYDSDVLGADFPVKNTELSKQFFADLNNEGLLSYEDYLTHTQQTDTAATRQQYQTALKTKRDEWRTKATEQNDGLLLALIDGPTAMLETYQGIIQDEIAQIQKSPQSFSSQTSIKRLRKINEWMTEIGKGELGLFAGVSDEAMNEFFTLLNTDRGTYQWAENLEKWAIQYGVNLGDIEQYAFEIYEIRLQSIIDKTQIAVQSLEELKEKNTKGFTWDEANTLLAQIQKIDPSATFKSIFDVNEQGLIILKDFGKTADQLYQGSLHDLYEQQQHLGEIVGNFEGKDSTSDSHFILQQGNKTRNFTNAVTPYLEALYGLIENTETTLEQDTQAAQDAARQISEQYGLNLSAEELASLTQAILDGKIQSYEDLVNFYASLRDNAANAYDVFSKQSKSLIASMAFDNWADRFTGAVNAKDMLSSGKKVSDLKDMWVKNFDSWNQKMFDSEEQALREQAIVWEESDFKALTDEQKAKLGVSNQEEFNDKYLNQVKNSDYWTTADYSQYYTYQSEALKLHGASLDAFGNLIITDWKKWGEYIADSYGYSEAKIAEMDDKDPKKAVAQEARNQILAEAKASQIETMESFNDSMEEGFTSILQNWIETGEVSFDDVKNIIDELQARGALSAAEYNNILDAYNNLTKGIGGSVEEFIRIISEAAADSGITYDVSAIQAAVEDAYANLIETLATALKNGIEGTLSATDFEALAKRYGLGEEDYINTATGRQLTRSGEAKTIAGMYDAAEASGSTYGLGAEVWKTLKNSGSQFQTYDDITKIIEEVETELVNEADVWCDALGVTRAEAEACLEVFKQIQAEARLDPDNPLFNFMEKDPTKGYGAGLDEVVSSTNKAIDALKSLQNEEKIAAKDFYNIFDQAYLGKDSKVSDLSWVAQMTGLTEEAVLQLSTAADKASFVYRDFVNGIMESHGKLGTIDGKVLANLGINITSMATGFGEGVKKVAEEQIKFLQGIRVFLVAMKEMSGLEDIKINIGFEFTNSKGENTTELSLDDLINWNSIVTNNKWDQDDIDTASAAVKTRLNNIVDNLDKSLQDTPYEGMWNNIFTHFFGKDGFTGSIEDGNALSILMGFVKNFGTLTPDEQRAALAQLATQIFGPDGKFVENWQQIVYDYFKDFDKSKLRIQLKDSVVAELGKLQIKVLNNEFILGEDQIWDGEDGLRTQVDAILAKQYGADGFKYIINDKKVTIVLIPEEVQTIINSPTVDETQWQWQESGENSGVYKRDIQVDGSTYTIHLSPNGEAIIVDTEGLPKDLPDDVTKQVFAAAGFVQDENGVYIKPEGEATKFQLNIAPTTSGVEEEAKTVTDIYNLLTGASDDAIAFKITINSEASGIAEILTKIKEAYEVLSQVSPVNFTVNGGLNIPKNNQNNPNFPLKPTYINVSLLPESKEELSSVITDLAIIDEPHTANIGVEISPSDTKTLNDTSNLLDKIDTTIYSATVKAERNTSSFDNVKKALDDLTKPREVTITVKEEKDNSAAASGTAGSASGIIGGGSGLVNAIAFSTDAKGNVALAGGNVSNLLAGAAFARGTLMGELGPELYVQGGQYHIAGANGPEFVDLHNDAIVFNHLQTAKLLNKGHINSHGSPVTDERTAVALAAGNVSGPAHANSNIDDAIAAVDAAIAMWRNIADASINDMLNASKGGGGGGSDTIKAVTVELQEWYNLTRKIAEVEERINKLLAERENIERRNGAAYLRNLREEQQYWREQLTYQTVLAQYQSAQLDRQREAIEQSEIWGQFFKFDSQGNIQFRNGNERDDGKGTLEFLQDLKSMGLEDQIKAIEKLGYSYTGADGNKLEGKELVEQFLKDIDAQMKNYESLYDTVKQAETKIEQIKTNIEKVEQQIKENQMDLEQDIYDTIVDAQEKVIEGLEEQKDLIEEANKAYVDGLNNALKAEKDLYSKNESISDREQLQRQLSLLRRSGGSASEIAALEEQLNDMLKNEYFSNQEDMIKDIEEANKEQIRKLEEQIKLQEEALEYQKEHGLIWSQVADIMSHDSDYILDFLQGNSPGFFSQSMMQQEQMLTEWAHKIGIFTEDRLMQNFMDEEADMWEGDKPQIFNSMDGELGTGDEKTSYGDFFSTLSDDDKEVVKKSYLQAYADARKEGKTEKEAREIAQEAIKTILGSYYDASLAPNNAPPSAQPDPGSGGGENPPTTVTPRKVYLYYDYEAEDGTQVKNQRVNITTGSTNKEEVYQALRNWANVHSRRHEGDPSKQRKAGVGVKTSMSRMRGFSEGGLVDYTGPAMVHGTPSKPEAFLNAQQTAMISEAVKASGDGGALDGIKATLDALNSTIKSIVNNNTNTTSSFTVAPGAVTIQVAELSDSYDVEELSKDVMNRIVAIASKSTNRGVNRR